MVVVFYHTSSELGVEATRRLQLQNTRILNNHHNIDNCGKMSIRDSLKDSHLVENRVIKFINELYTKVTQFELSPLVSILFISKSLNIPEDEIAFILNKNGIELICVEEEDE